MAHSDFLLPVLAVIDLMLVHHCDTICLCVFRGPSVKRSSGMERSQSSTWDTSEENKNKLVKAASTSKLLAKVVKNAERYVHILLNVKSWRTEGCLLMLFKLFFLVHHFLLCFGSF